MNAPEQVKQLVERFYAERDALDPDTAPNVSVARTMQKTRAVLAGRAQALQAAAATVERVDPRLAEAESWRAFLLAVQDEHAAALAALDPAAVRDSHEQRRAYETQEGLRLSLACLRRGWDYMNGHAVVPTVLERDLLARGAKPLPGMTNVFDGRSGLLWVDGLLAELRAKRAAAQTIIDRELAAVVTV